MAKFELLPPEVLAVISSKASAILFGEALGGPDLKIFESMDIWTINAVDVLTHTDDLRKLAKRAGRWHHQIKSAGVPVAFAASLPQGPSPQDWIVLEVTVSKEISGLVDDAIVWISSETGIAADTTVRMLNVPAFHLRAFWLLDSNADQRIVMIDNSGASTLQLRQSYDVDSFLSALRATSVVRGLV